MNVVEQQPPGAAEYSILSVANLFFVAANLVR